ncbi:MAG: transcription termination/antitermination protein NusA [Sulfobacillus thermosulfidooxidans]|uniref:Transcription termination/antitermination protein NusA n=1 Tax=Sulfobacillus thermotolerans TaxID=338644 RepID=A0ABN5H406_9FIRM|nr:transcription termination factor NusA [Sulfobacillus sp. hq2]AUW95455.1 transcription termination/antitermination protein NusA [Sulfobacillus thermotolerans]MCY0907208.1 transcription termination factor NusA [Sulfobacillus thermotolerans]POB10948.1 transcription termination/antitermination protein NusA [Sulfobacillus sp. hq2]PSR37635.1 MAG: transcription termination/antitermination protein NusA [Sulfobacillus thermosulfidooxidans]
MNAELLGALDDLEREKGIDKEILFQAIESALISAYRRNFASAQNVRVRIDRESGATQVWAQKTVVAEVQDHRLEVGLDEAREIRPGSIEGDILEFEVTPKNFGRIAAQTAKQVIVQRIREAERGLIYEEFVGREGDIVTGTIQRSERGLIYINLGRTEAIMMPSEQVPNERLRLNEHVKLYVVEVKKTNKGPQIFVSRSHPGLIKRLFELEVPEIHDGIVEIKGIAREPGARTKIAVWAEDPNIDPVGSCVGAKGTRVQAIVQELHGEKLDIIRWDRDPTIFVANALSPAQVTEVVVEPDTRAARVVVPDNQLSLGIGKEGQNARLAAKLTGWKVDLRSESQVSGGGLW